jgi:phosphohistidine phosphatase
MLTLSLLRHAKSSWDDPSLDDFDRPLAKRGEAAAARMGAYIAKHGIAPELVLCSTAQRARQTLKLLLPQLAARPEVAYEDGLYLAPASQMLARVRTLDDKVQHAMIIGHDPGMHALAVELSGSGNARDLQALARKFPTAALAVVRFKTREWAKIGPSRGSLDTFVTPKMLA